VGVKLKERFPGEWWMIINHKGKRKSKKIGHDYKKALEVVRKVEAKFTLGDLKILEEENRGPTFKEIAERWLETVVKPDKRKSTYTGYESSLRVRIYPVLGEVPVNQITRKMIRDLVLDLKGKKYSQGSLMTVRNAISGPLNEAVLSGLISENPFNGALKGLNRRKSESRDEINPYREEEVFAFLEVCGREYPEHFPLFLTAFRTGLRMGELLALRWGKIDWQGKTIRVDESFHLHEFGPTKSGKVRTVDISEELFRVLSALHTQRKREGLQMGLGGAVEFLFHRKGQPILQGTVRDIFRRIQARSKLREIRFHDIRHTFASILLSRGASILYVSKQLGHSRVSITLDIYGHWIPDENKKLVNLLDRAQPGATQTQPMGLIVGNH